MLQSIDISHFPHQPWVYLFKDSKGTILYIGKAKNLFKRISQYFTPWSVWKQEMLAQASNIDFLITKNESESLYLESNLIKQHLPAFNNMLKGANAYAYIKLSKHPVPQVLITRKKLNDGALYIWPKHNTKELKKFLQYLRQIIQYRTCPLSQFRQGKLCSDYYFGLCQWWCAKPELPLPDYQKTLTSFFKWDTKPIEKEIRNLIESAIQQENFERAAKLRDIYFHIDQFTEKQTVEFAKAITGYLLQIRLIGKQWVYVLLNFYEGKLIDVIRHHFSQEDTDESTMIASFGSEFWTFERDEDRYSTNNIKRTNTEREAMHKMFENFFESYITIQSMQGSGMTNDLLKTLEERYQLGRFPYQIECLDISHLGGDQTSGGLSCLVAGLEEKKLYRKYKITSVKNDDYLALQEVLIRRFQLEKTTPSELHLPDLFILDGGKGQLGILENLLLRFPQLKTIMQQVTFASLGKWEARKQSNIGKKSKKSNESIGEVLYLRSPSKILSFPLVYDAVDRLLIKVRNEAHRFANAYRKKQATLDFHTQEVKARKNHI